MSSARCEHGVRWFRHCPVCILGPGLLGVDFVEVRFDLVDCPTCGHAQPRPTHQPPLFELPLPPWGPRCEHGRWPESAASCLHCDVASGMRFADAVGRTDVRRTFPKTLRAV